MNVREITPRWLARRIADVTALTVFILNFLRKLATCGRRCVRPEFMSGKIFLTPIVIRRRHGQARGQTGRQGDRAGSLFNQLCERVQMIPV